MQVVTKTNELPPGSYGRHLFVAGKWSGDVGRQLDEGSFPMVTFEGSWGDCSFFERHGASIKWLNIVNAQKTLGGVRFLSNLERLLVGFEPKDLSTVTTLDNLQVLEIFAKVPALLLSHPSIKRLKLSGAAEFDVQCQNDVLRELFLVRPKIDSLLELRGLRALENLDIYGAKGLSSLDGIEQFAKLEMLGIEACAHLKDLDQLASAKSLKKVSVVRSAVSELPTLAAHLSLQMLHIGGHPIQVDWDDLFACQSLNHIAVLAARAIDKDVVIAAAAGAGRTIAELTIIGGKHKFVTVILGETARGQTARTE